MTANKKTTASKPLIADTKERLTAHEAKVADLQERLSTVENGFDNLRKLGIREGTQWDAVCENARLIRSELFDLTGDCYGKPKIKNTRPPIDLLDAAYEYPWDVPKEVMSWARQQSLLTSDASDAIRWARIIDTACDDRYPSGSITIYRALASGDEIRPGDWVTTNKSYAEDHLSRYLNGNGYILEEIVDGREVLISPTGNDEEAIYAPLCYSDEIDYDLIEEEYLGKTMG